MRADQTCFCSCVLDPEMLNEAKDQVTGGYDRGWEPEPRPRPRPTL